MNHLWNWLIGKFDIHALCEDIENIMIYSCVLMYTSYFFLFIFNRNTEYVGYNEIEGKKCFFNVKLFAKLYIVKKK